MEQPFLGLTTYQPTAQYKMARYTHVLILAPLVLILKNGAHYTSELVDTTAAHPRTRADNTDISWDDGIVHFRSQSKSSASWLVDVPHTLHMMT